MPTIRPATPDDLPAIFELIKELAAYENSPVAATEELIRAHLFPRAGGRPWGPEALLAEVPGQAGPVGLALFYPAYSTGSGLPEAFVEDLYVRPEHRGAGIGRLLLARVAAVAVQRGWSGVTWGVVGWNEPAIGFYKHLGAVSLEDWTVYRLEGDAMQRLARGGA